MNAPNNANATNDANTANKNAANANAANAGHDAATYRSQIARLLVSIELETDPRTRPMNDADRLHAVREHLMTTMVRLTGLTYAQVYSSFLVDA